jgi:Arc/MetJ family transcription regulator
MTPFEIVCAALRAELDNAEHITKLVEREDDESVLVVMQTGEGNERAMQLARIFVDQGDLDDLELAEAALRAAVQ